MKRHFFRFLSLLLFVVTANTVWGQPTDLEIMVIRGNNTTTVTGRLSGVTPKTNVTKLVITKGDFIEEDWKQLDKFPVLQVFRIKETIDSVYSIVKSRNRYTSCIGDDDHGNSIGGKDNQPIKLPATLDTIEIYKLYQCPGHLFKKNANLKVVSMPDLTILGGIIPKISNLNLNGPAGETFLDCTALDSVNMPNVKYVGRMCFKNCPSLKKIYLPSATFIGYGAFSMDNGSSPALEIAYLPKLDTLGMHAFQRGTALTHLILGSTVPVVLGFRHDDNSAATPALCDGGIMINDKYKIGYSDKETDGVLFAVPNSVFITTTNEDGFNQDINNPNQGTGLWWGCYVGHSYPLKIRINNEAPVEVLHLRTALRNFAGGFAEIDSFEVVEGNLTIRDWYFLRDTIKVNPWSKLKKVKINTAVTAIPTLNSGETLFPNTLEAFIGDSVMAVGDRVFSGLTNLATVSLHRVRTIGHLAFSGCTALKELNLPNVCEICDDAFTNCSALKKIRLSRLLVPQVVYYNTVGTYIPKANGNPFVGCPDLRFLDFLDDDGVTVLYPSTDANMMAKYKAAKLLYKGDVGFNQVKTDTWRGWEFFKEYSVTVNAQYGQVGSFISPNNTILALDSLETVRLGKYAFTPLGGYALHPSLRGITSSDVTIGADTTFIMPAKNVTVNVAFEPIYSIDGDTTTTKLDTLVSAGGIVYPRDSLFAGDSVLIKDIITPNPGYEIDTVRLWYCSSDPCTWQPLSAPYVTGSPATMNDTIIVPGGKIKIDVKFQPSHTVTVYYSENGALPKDTAVYRLAPDSTLAIPVNPQPCFEKTGISSPSHSAQLDADNNRITMPSTAVNMEVWVTYGRISYTLSYTASAGGYIDGPATQTVDCGDDGQPVTAKPIDSSTSRFVQWLDNGSNNATRQDKGVKANISVEAQFEPLYTLTYTVINGTAPADTYHGAGDAVQITGHRPAAGYRFKNIRAYETGNETNTVGLTFGASDTTFTMPSHGVTVEVEYALTYSVSIAAHSNGTAAATPSDNLFEGEPVQLDIAPSTGYGLKVLTVVDAIGNGVSYTPVDLQRTGSSTYTFAMPAADVTVTPVFAPIFNVNITATNGTATATPSADLFEGDEVQLTLTPDGGHKLRSISAYEAGNPSQAVSVGAGHRFDMPAADVQVDVLFEKFYNIYPDPAHPQDTLTDAHGNRTCPVDSLFAGDRVALQDVIKPAAGYTIDQISISRWDGSAWVALSDAEVAALLTKSPATLNDSLIMPAYDIKFEATFKPAFTVQVYYSQGSKQGDATYDVLPGDQQTIIVDPEDCYELQGITAQEVGGTQGGLNGQLNGNIFTMPNPAVNVRVDVIFRKIQHTLSYSASAGGYIDGPATQTVDCGDDGQPVTAKPTDATKARFVQWSGGSTENPRTDKGVKTDISVEAQFEPLYTLTYEVTNGTPPADSYYGAGDAVQITGHRPAAGYRFKNIRAYETGNETNTVQLNIGATDTTLAMPAHGVTVKVEYALTYSVSIAAHSNGTATATPSDNLFEGEPVQLDIAPSTGYGLKVLQVEKASGGDIAYSPIALQRTGASSYTFNMPAADVTVTPVFAAIYDVSITASNGTATASATAELFEGEEVQLTLTPDGGHKLRSLSIHETGNPSKSVAYSADYRFNMPASNVQVDVVFEKFYNIYPDPAHPQDTLTDVYGNRTCPVDSVFAGDRVGLQDVIKPAAGYTIDQISISRWDGSAWVALTEPEMAALFTKAPPTLNDTLIMPAYDIKFEVSFKPAFTVQVYYQPDGISTVSSPYSTTGSPSEAIKIPIKPIDGYRLKLGGISAHEAEDPSNDLTAYVNMADSTITMPSTGLNIVVHVEFELNVLTLQYSHTTGGTLSGELTQQVSYGSDGTPVEAVPEAGYGFRWWSDHKKDNPRTDLAVKADLSVEAIFEPIYSVSTVANNGSITATPASGLFAGDTVLIGIAPDGCYDFVSMAAYQTGDETNTVALKPTNDSLIMPAHDVTVEATFERKKVNVGLVVHAPQYFHNSDAASITGIPSSTMAMYDYLEKDVDCGSTVTLTCTPKANYRFKGWYIVDGGHKLLSTDNPYTLTVGETTMNLIAIVDEPIVDPVVIASSCGPFEWYGETYTTSGDHERVFPGAYQDTVRKLSLTIYPEHTDIHDYATFCGSHTWEGDTYTAPGDYTKTLTSKLGGCDSTVTLHLTAEPAITHEFSIAVCGGYTWKYADGTPRLLDADGTYTETYTTAAGCDSTVTLHLSIVTEFNETAVVETCESTYTWKYADGTPRLLDADGPYTETYTTAAGCDSTVTLQLTLNRAAYNEDISISACTYSFKDEHGNDIVVNASGDYTGKYTAINGCDSIVTLHFSATTGYSETIDEATCFSEYSWTKADGTVQQLTASGTYTETFITAAGCDSTITLNLTFNTPTTIIRDTAATAYGSFSWRGDTYNNDGKHTKTETSADGCTITTTVLNLTMLSAVPADTTVNICAKELPYVWYGDDLYTPGDHEKMLPQGAGQPPIRATLLLNIHPEYSVDAATSFCGAAGYTWNGTTYTTEGDYTATLTSRHGCDSTVTLHLTMVDAYRDTMAVSTCQGSYTWAKPDGTTETYTASGDYSCTVASAAGCDSTVVLRLLLNDSQSPVYNEVWEAICGDSFTWNGNTYTTSGDYKASISTGCRDSIVTLHLTIEQAPAPVVLDTTIRRSQAPFAWGGNQLTDGGTYRLPIVTAAGCAVTDVLHLTVLEPVVVDEAVSICANQTPYRWEGNVLDKTGNHEATVLNPNGQDTLKTLNLTVHPVYSGIEDHASFCGSYTWAGSTYTQAGTYTATLQTAVGGCDSTVTLHLTEVAAYAEAVTVSTCEASYAFKDGSGNDIVLTESGVYTGKYFTAGGCDSLVTLTLELGVTEPITHEFSVAACQNYIWNNQTYTASGDYTATFAGQGSCGRDSTVTLHLSISTPPTAIYEAATIREGHAYRWAGETYTTAGTYTKTERLATGCEQVRVLYLNVIERVYDTIATSICANEAPYSWHGWNLNSTGGVSHLVEHELGDTLYQLNLTVHPVYSIDATASFCGAAGYTWNGTTYTTEGDYTSTLTSRYGCDSTVTLHLSRVDGYRDTIQHSTCQASYTWAKPDGSSETYSTSGDYSCTVAAVGGCDSTVVLRLLLSDDLSPVYNEVWESICGDSYTWQGQDYTTSGDYTASISTGCRDSIVTLHLSIGQPSTTVIDSVVCGMASFEWAGETYSGSGISQHIRTFKTANGCCDSTVVLNLSLHDNERYWLTVLATDSYLWNGRLYTESGSYTDSLKNMHGCDSVVTLYLTIVEQGENTLGIEGVERESLTLYPNPTTGIINLEAPLASEVLVYSVSGQLMLRQPLLPVGSTQVDMSRMPAGIYIVRAGGAAARVVKL